MPPRRLPTSRPSTLTQLIFNVGGQASAATTITGLNGADVTTRADIASKVQDAIQAITAGTNIDWSEVEFSWNGTAYVLTGGAGYNGRITAASITNEGSGTLANVLGFASGTPTLVSPSMTLRLGTTDLTVGPFPTESALALGGLTTSVAVAERVQAAVRSTGNVNSNAEAANVTFTWDSGDSRYVLTGTLNTGGALTDTAFSGGALANALGMSGGLGGLHFDPGVATDSAETAEIAMNAIQRENDSWYWVVAAEGSVGGEQDIAGESGDKLNDLSVWCENNRKQFIYGSNNVTDDNLLGNVNAAAPAPQRYGDTEWDNGKTARDTAWAGLIPTGDASWPATTAKAVRLISANRQRTSVLYGGTNRAIALAGRFASNNLDEKRLITAKFQQLASGSSDADNGDPLTPTQIAVMNERRINHYTRVAGTPVVREGVTTNSSRFIDTRYWLDWFGHRVRVDIWNLLTSNPRVPLTNEGVVSIRNVVEAVCQRGVENGGLGRGQLTPETIDQVQRVTSTPRLRRLPDGWLPGLCCSREHAYG